MTATVTDKQYRLLIGGEWVEGAGGTYDVVNPATEQVVAPAPEATADDVYAAAAAAKAAFPAWSHTTPEARAALDALVKDLEQSLPFVWGRRVHTAGVFVQRVLHVRLLQTHVVHAEVSVLLLLQRQGAQRSGGEPRGRAGARCQVLERSQAADMSHINGALSVSAPAFRDPRPRG